MNDKYGFTFIDQMLSHCNSLEPSQRLNSLLSGCAVCPSDKPLFYAVPKGAKIKLIMLGNITDEPSLYLQPKCLCGFMLQHMLY